MYVISRRMSGTLSAFLSLVLLLIDDTYLIYSRTVQGEVPCIALALLAFFLAIIFHRTHDYRYIFSAGVVSSLTAGIKLFGVTVLLPIFLLFFSSVYVKRQFSLTNYLKGLALFLIGLSLPIIPLFLLFDLNSLYNQLFLFHLNKPKPEVFEKISYLIKVLLYKNPGLSVFCAIGLVAGILSRDPMKLSLIAWIIASAFKLIFMPQPIWLHHLSFLIPILSLLSGLSADFFKKTIYQVSLTKRVLNVRAVIVLLLIATSIGSSVIVIPKLQHRMTVGDNKLLVDVINVLDNVTEPDSIIVTDDQFLAFIARRNVPPELCDTSRMRIESGFLTDREAIEVLNRYNVTLIVFWKDRLIRLQGFLRYVEEHYNLLKAFDHGKLIYYREI